MGKNGKGLNMNVKGKNEGKKQADHQNSVARGRGWGAVLQVSFLKAGTTWSRAKCFTWGRTGTE